MKNYRLIGLMLTTISMCVGCNGKSITKVKNEQMGLVLSSYFDAIARQPESLDNFNVFKEDFLEKFDKANTEGKCYALGCLGGADNSNRYYERSAGGLFNSLARQPEIFDELKNIQNDATNRILNSKKDAYAEMIGLSTSYLYDSLARMPEEYDRFITYSTYINDSITNVKKTEYAYSIGYASTGFYESVARQVESADDMWYSFKTYINTLIRL